MSDDICNCDEFINACKRGNMAAIIPYDKDVRKYEQGNTFILHQKDDHCPRCHKLKNVVRVRKGQEPSELYTWDSDIGAWGV